MRSRLHPCLARLVLAGLLIVALAAGFGARPVLSEMDLRLEAWVMAGGSLDDLCNDHGAGDDHKSHCPLCNLAAPTGLPPVFVPGVYAEQRILARIVLPQIRRAAGHARDPAVPKRGPPILT